MNPQKADSRAIDYVKYLCALAFVGSMLFPERANGFIVPIIRLTTALALAEVFGLRFFIKSTLIAFAIDTSLIAYASATHRWLPYDISLKEMVSLKSASAIPHEIWRIVVISSIVAFWLSLIAGCCSLGKYSFWSDRIQLWLRLIVAITSMQVIKVVFGAISISVGMYWYEREWDFSARIIKDQITLEIAYYLIYLAVVVPLVVLCVHGMRRIKE